MSAKAPAVLVLAALVAGGAYNYHRNARLEREAAGQRPYGGLSDADLEVLTAAYEAELQSLKHRLSEIGEPSAAGRPKSPSDLGQRVRDFERAQFSNERWRAIHGDVKDRESQLEKLRQEASARRAAGESGWLRFLRLLTTL
jgi:hypothetical protein